MSAKIILWVSVCAAFVELSTAHAGQLKILKGDVSFPEGPIYVDGTLYLVDYAGQTILKESDGALKPIWKQAGCGPNGLAHPAEGLFVACYDSNQIEIVSLDGKTLTAVATDDAGKPFLGPGPGRRLGRRHLVYGVGSVRDRADCRQGLFDLFLISARAIAASSFRGAHGQ